MPNRLEEYYRRSQDIKAAAAEEKDPVVREDMIETADEYAELIKLLQDA